MKVAGSRNRPIAAGRVGAAPADAEGARIEAWRVQGSLGAWSPAERALHGIPGSISAEMRGFLRMQEARAGSIISEIAVRSSSGLSHERGRMNTTELDEMGPIDYILVEWPGRQPTGEAVPQLVDLVDRGLIRLLDLAFIAKGEDGSVARLEIADVGGEVEEFAVFEGASSGLLSEEDTAEAAQAMEPGTSAALLVYENRWAAPFAAAVRRGGGQLVAGGRIPVQAILAALDAAEEESQANE